MTDFPNLPPITDHAFMREVHRHCDDMSKSMVEIATELGCDVDDLCRWVMAYKAPHRAKPYRGKSTPAVTYQGRTISSMDDYAHEAAAFKVWKREHDGVVAALGRDA